MRNGVALACRPNVRFNGTLMQNQKLRDDIYSLRVEKGHLRQHLQQGVRQAGEREARRQPDHRRDDAGLRAPVRVAVS